MLRFSFVVAILLFSSFIEAKYGAECTTPNNEAGLCMPITSCSNALNMFLEIQHGRSLHNFQFLKDSFCGSVDNAAYVCCSEKEIQMNTEIIEHLKKVDCGIGGRNKVSHGENANLFDFRWMILLKYEGDNLFLCDGALIDDQHVLTAAHCLHNNTFLPVAIRVGEYNITSAKDCAEFGDEKKCLDPVEDIPIKTIIPHENYVYGDIKHDIALIRLEKPVRCNVGVSPICLPINKDPLPENFIVSGWGNTENNVRSHVLQYANVPKRGTQLCMEKFPVSLGDGHICAGGKNFQDSCKGDSGGPLFQQIMYVRDQRSVQFGIVSAGVRTKKCGAKNLPGIYTNVVHYMQWITDHMMLGKNVEHTSCYVK